MRTLKHLVWLSKKYLLRKNLVQWLYKLSKFNFPDPLCVLSCTAQLPVQSGGVQTLAVVTVGPPRSGLVKPIYRNISYSQLVTTRRPENINLATTKTPATLRSYKYHKKKQSLLKCHELSDNFHHFMVWFDVYLFHLSPKSGIITIGIDRSPSNNALNRQLTQSYHVSSWLFQLFKWDLLKLKIKYLEILTTLVKHSHFSEFFPPFSSTNQMRISHKTSKKVQIF